MMNGFSNFCRKRLVALLAVAGVLVSAAAQQPADSLPPSDSVAVSLLTFYPGDEIFSLFGHTELRITRSTEDDYCFDYGVFEFQMPSFLFRFVAGDADYMCGVKPTRYMTRGMQGRRLVEQRLNLTQEQASLLRDYLIINSMPENNTYRYRYLTDNCSTRPRDLIEQVIGVPMNYPAAQQFVTYRDIMSHYTRNYPWEQFGIDLVLGSKLDVPLDARGQMFVPLALMQAFDGAYYERDSMAVPLVSDTRVLVNTSTQGTVLPPTPWWRTPVAVACLMLTVTLAFVWRDVRRKKITHWFHRVVFGLYGLVGCLLFYLTLFSTQEATSPNWNLVWCNPLMLLPAMTARPQAVLRIYHVVNLLAIVLLALLWPFIPQVANVAFFPLMAIPALCSLTSLVLMRDSR
ncbi:MAG: DUF4105 domain-containing protein [Muribaculaceae bacterium]|nr:DUF4105 domain-containing protein [Muribaculaceae bacterium]